VQHPAPHPRGDAPVEPPLRALLAETLGLPRKRVDGFDADTALFGALPEFDSMAVAHFLTGFEEKFAVIIEDDDVEAEDFATFGTLLAFAERVAAK
jgi:acyl carrier protein